MEVSNQVDSWTAVVSEASATTVDALIKVIDFSNPPAYFDFARSQWERRKEGEGGCWDLLVDGQTILRAVGHPMVLTLEQARTLAGYALHADSLFHTKLLRRLLANRLWPEEVPSEEAMRALEVLETLDDSRRLAMTLLKFSKFPDRRVQSKVAKILGRWVESVEVMEDLFRNVDGRVRANLLEGLGRRENLDMYPRLIERATRDQHPRVSSMALAIRARQGYEGAGALLRLRMNSKMSEIRRSAEFARKIAAGEFTSRDGERSLERIRLAGNVDSLSVVACQATMGASVEEVDGQTKAHPDEQP